METEAKLKIKFARLLLKTPNEPFKAALGVFPNNTNMALRVANEWPFDDAVVKFKDEIVEDVGEMSFLPTKVDLARLIWNKMQSDVADDDFVKLAKLYGDVRGFIEKPSIAINTSVQNVANKVMIVRESKTTDDWEKRLMDQQNRLTNATSIN